MFPQWRLIVAAVLSSSAYMTGIAGAADSFTATNGAILRAPEIAGLTCPQMTNLLQEYSSSGYRDAEMLSEDHPDRPIFDYEDQLATTFYDDCQAGTAQFLDTGSVFGRGFTD